MGCHCEDKYPISETSSSRECWVQLSLRQLSSVSYMPQFRDSTGKKRPVERRKLEKHYLVFIKTSQKYYRDYVQRLASHFGGMPELEKVARRFNFDSKRQVFPC